jgi:hypothetical protein
MKDYSGPEYKNLYEEILLDYHYRFPKFHPIPYPQFPNRSSLINNINPPIKETKWTQLNNNYVMMLLMY